MNKKELAERILPLIDLTSLNDTDNDDVIRKLCAAAVTPFGEVAAVCVYSRFVKLAKNLLSDFDIKIATVCNFPGGDQKIEDVLRETEQALIDGANEIDLVIPYKDYLSGNKKTTTDLITQCKKLLNQAASPSSRGLTAGSRFPASAGNDNKQLPLLKVILETGALQKPDIITAASEDAIRAGADFLKTSTGKIAINATPETAELMLTAIRKSQKRNIGFKAAGGIRTIAQAVPYLQLADEIMGENWVTPKTFRFGASSLLDDVLKNIKS